jgi:DNA-binding GntR family transcriptional regulator
MDIVKKTMSQQVYEVIKNDILCQHLRFGEKLTNASLQERYGVGAMPIRDAIIRLHQDGLVGEITKGGTHVVTLDLPTALEINEIAQLLCSSAVQLSGLRAENGDVCQRLESSVAAQEKNIGNDKYFDFDYDFHCTFFDYAGNSQYKKVYRLYSGLLEMISRCASEHGMTMRKEAIEMHKKIMAACKAGFFSEAAENMRQHYNDGAKHLMRYFAESVDEE